MKTVAILGCAEGWQNAPSDGDCWGITNIVLRRPVTAAFDIHDLTWTVQQWYDHYVIWIGRYFNANQMLAKAQQRVQQVQPVFKAVKEMGCPFYTTRTYDELPSSVAFPIKEVIEHFGINYFGSTFDYAIAKAILDGYEKIDLYGVRMSFHDEYAHQGRSAHYWIGLARGMGIETTVHGVSSLLHNENKLLYGYNVKETSDAS